MPTPPVVAGDRRSITIGSINGRRKVATTQNAHARFDLIYADAWPGKFTHLDRALSLLTRGGIYFIDDLLPQPS